MHHMAYTRREFFSALGRSLADRITALGQETGPAQVPRPVPLPFLRPPGAVDEVTFLNRCTRCTDCIDACPYDAIKRLGSEFGSDAGTPAIIAHESPCHLCEDLPCISACETGALQPTARREVAMGTAFIDLPRCYRTAGQPCDYCVTRCPVSDTAIAWDENDLPRIDPAHCTGCGVCVHQCPADAIAITDRMAPPPPDAAT